MERHPIKTPPTEVAVKLVENPLTYSDLLPNYRFQYQSGEVSEEADQMFLELVEFVKVNEDLALPDNDNPMYREGWVKGFKKALALTRLWIDSIYLQPNTENSDDIK